MPDQDVDQLAVVVEVTPRVYRRRAVLCVAGGVALLVLSVALRSLGSGVLWGAAGIGYGGWCAVQARRQRTSTTLRIDRAGLRTSNGLHDHTWGGVAMVWVGSASGLRLPIVVGPVVSVFTDAGVDFAERAGTKLTSRYTIPVGAPWRVDRLCDRLREITDVPVVDGRVTSRSRAAAAALGGTAQAG